MSGNLAPSSANTYSLGSPTNSWNQLSLGPWTIRSIPSGTLDTNFGNQGTVVSNAPIPSYSTNIVIDKDNRVIVGGIFDVNGYSNYGFVRYLPTGVIDTVFGEQGYVITDISNDFNVSSNFFSGKIVTVDTSNNIIFAGTTGFNNQYYVILARYSSSGDIDTTFGVNGYVITDFSGNDSSIETSVALDQQNNIIVVGNNTDSDGNTHYALAKYSANGVIDASFGTNGFVVADFAMNGLSSYANSVAIDQQNNIIIAGYSATNNNGQFYYYALAKYSANGVLDTGFGNGGSVVTTFSSIDYSAAFSVAIDQQNNILVAGVDQVNNINDYNYTIAKYDTYGQIVTGFGNNGVVETDFSGNYSSFALSVVVDQQNNIIVSGFASADSYSLSFYGLSNYDNNGVLDTTFGNNGAILTEFGYNVSISLANSVVIDQQNNILVGGVVFFPNMNYVLAKYINYVDLVAQLSGQPEGPVYSLIRNLR